MLPATFTDRVFAPFEEASSNRLLCGWYLIAPCLPCPCSAKEMQTGLALGLVYSLVN